MQRPPATRETTKPAEQPATQTDTAPATQPPAATQAATRPVEPRRPLRVSLEWARLADVFETRDDAIVSGRWTGGNRIEIDTKNVRRMILDLTELPPGAPRRPPWNLQIDGQGIELTGRRGLRVEFTRGDTGAWNVTGPPPRNP